MPAMAGVNTIRTKKMRAIEYTPFVMLALAENCSKTRSRRAKMLVESAVRALAFS